LVAQLFYKFSLKNKDGRAVFRAARQFESLALGREVAKKTKK
jgi:hypothetical protein